MGLPGVHIGHQALFHEVIEKADAIKGTAIAMTFEPHPRQFFAPNSPAFRLTGPAARASRLAKLGVDILFELPFNAGLAALSPHAFAQDMIAKGLGLSHVLEALERRAG